MRILLIDNHDSFTFNLAHDIAAVTGTMPDVVPHDAPLNRPVQAWMESYDAVVVSPGPGTPERASDLGHSRAAVEQDVVPVLGVCLGMQAMALAAGGRVVRAPTPVHGEVADIRHRGTGLFAGLPDPLPMVRYHSLVVADLPASVVVDATCDGLVMGVHHRSRPHWGVQTHPESICSAHGRDILAIFFRLAVEWNISHGRSSAPAGGDDPVGESAAAAPRSTKARPPAVDGSTVVVSEAESGTSERPTLLARRLDLAPGVDGETVFDAVFRGGDHAWWLDSAAGGGVSACGSAAGPLSRVAVQHTDGVHVRDAAGERTHAGDILDLMADDTTAPVRCVDAAGEEIDVRDLPFAPGWVGCLGYEHGVGTLLGDPLDAVTVDDMPTATVVFTDRVVSTVAGSAWVVALLPSAQADIAAQVEAAQRAWVENTAAALCDLAPTPHGTGAPPTPSTGAVTLRHDRATYLDLVARCQEYIAAGESYELCLTNRITVQGRTDPWALYRRLRATSPRPFGAYLAFDDVHVLSASPERFLSVDADGLVEAKPIKGTRRRGTDDAEDARLATELRNDVKERAENLMIVDLLRHDLSRVCAPGSVHVPLLFDVETHAGVHQLVSTIRGRLAPGATPLDAVRAALPGGSMTGAPKERSVRLLRDLEAGPRGIYSGIVGYVSITGVTDWSIVIRTIVHRPDHLTYGVGGAITVRSDAVAEWEETLVKARTLGTALGVDLDAVLDS